MAYVYRHIRLDKNEPFYIGIGSDNRYQRAFCKKTRNNIWNKITNKTSYEVEILLDNLSVEDAKKKEIEFISLYKRIDNGNGVLANMTDGGEGCKGLIHTLESRIKMGDANRGKTISLENRKKVSEFHKGKVTPEYVKRKISIAQMGRKHSQESIEKMRISSMNPVFSPETRLKISIANKGKVRSDETKRKLSIANSGANHPFYGKKLPDSTKEKIKKSAKRGVDARSAILNESQVIEIRKIRELEGMSHGKIAKKYNIGKSAITSIINRKTWTHI